MYRTIYLNVYHRAYAKRMKLSAQRRSKQPPMSSGEFMVQVQRLQQSSLRKQE
jgi:hypothetical protein